MVRIRKNKNTTSANAPRYYSVRTVYQVPNYKELKKTAVKKLISKRFS